MAASASSVEKRSSVNMGFTRFTGLIILIAISNYVCEVHGKPSIPFDVLYNAGIEAYVAENWAECASLMKRALADHRMFLDLLIDCRIRCERISKPSEHLSDHEKAARDNHRDLAFFETALKRSNCIRRCKKDRLSDRPESFNDEIMKEFEKLKPYDYLQICAIKSEDYRTAASAAFTFVLANPDHDIMYQNVQYYKTLDQVKEEYFYNMELKRHQDLYMQGVDTYEKGRYSETTVHIEAALGEYYKESHRCSVTCEGIYDHESFPEFYLAISDHYVNVLRCKQGCRGKLATINGVLVENYLAEHYNYLQFSYYQLSKLPEAAASAATYLMMNPGDETMNQNKAFYLTLPEVEEKDFVTRMDALQHNEALVLEQQMMNFVDRKYKFSDADEDNGEQEKPTVEWAEIIDPDEFRNPDYYSPEKRKAHAFGDRDEESFRRFAVEMKSKGITIQGREGDLGGTDRIVLDDLLTTEQCETLSELAKFGFGGSEPEELSKYAVYEVYDGLKILGFRELLKNHTISVPTAKLFLDSTDQVREAVSSYYNVKWPIYIDFMHIACKNPIVDKNGNPRAEYFSRIHADNCKIKEDKTCIREYPARYWRDFTAILYLNESDGGEFGFADYDNNIVHKVAPKCGRMVAFNASHPHGVMAYKSAKRCSIGMWMTLDPAFADKQINYAKADTNVVQQLNDNEPFKDFIEERGIQLNMTETELNGPERMAVDGAATEEECDILIQLATVGGVAGDGYKTGGLTSVDTPNERFAGLTVAAAAQRAAEGQLPPEWVKLYTQKSRLVKDITEKYFKLKTPLYFDYTHLVCRTALHDKDKLRTDLSHPVHSDNCIIQPDNSCKKAPPAYVQRDYSALLYLNSNFSGGDFIFTHENMTIQTVVRPRCGMAVTFNAGNYHGVQAVTEGSRCALAMWFTLDKNFDEAAHFQAAQILRDFEAKPLGPPLSANSHGEL